MRNKILLLVLSMLLQGCLQYTKSGSLLSDNPQYYNEWSSGGSSSYITMLPFDTLEYGEIQSSVMPYKNTIILRLPDRIKDPECRFFSWILFPVYFKRCDMNTVDQNENIYVYIYKPYYTLDFLDGVSISLRYQNRIYLTKAENIRSYDGSSNYLRFNFPITIKEIKENGADLIVDYKNYHKEVPLGYKLMWHRG